MIDEDGILFQIFFSAQPTPPDPIFYTEDDDETIYTDDNDNPFIYP